MKTHAVTQTQTTTNSKWSKHPLMKRIINHRFKFILLPLLGLPIPLGNNQAKEEVNQVPMVSEEKNTENHDFLKYRYYPCIAGAIVLHLIVGGCDAFVKTPRKRRAVHEIGHLIALKAIQHPTILDFVEVERNGREKNEVGHTLPSDYSLFFDDSGNPSLRRFVQNSIALRAGESMERLVYGYANHFLAHGDRLLGLIQKTFGLAYCLKLNPRQFGNLIKFFTQIEKHTSTLLKQVDPETVNKLAERLSEKGHWNTKETESIIKEFGLDKLPAFEETIHEIRKILE